MTQEKIVPKIQSDLDLATLSSNSFPYLEIIKNILKKILPDRFFDLYQHFPGNRDEFQKYTHSIFPLIHVTHCSKVPGNMTFNILYKYRASAFKFCYEMISRWLIPGKTLDIMMMYAVDFSMPEIGNDLYTLCEMTIRVKSAEELEQIQLNLPTIQSEISLSVVSDYYARRILEVKGLSSNEKTAMIQEYIAYMISRYPEDFSFDVFTEMQYVLLMCRDDFKAERGIRHLSRLICIQYSFRKQLRDVLKQQPDKRHLFVKIFKAKLHPDGEKKSILGLIVAVNFLRKQEVFEEAHLLRAVKNYIPNARAVKHSFFFNRRANEPICTLYLELEKPSGEPFTGEEMRVLRKELPADLEGRVEHLMHPVFMPRNEEEVMRNILTLSQQIKFLRDIPQMFITFEKQTHNHLFFTVIVVRVVKSVSQSIQDLFKASNSEMEYIHDQSKTIGVLRKKYQKQATVFRLKVSKEQFLRHDHSIDLYKARQAVVNEISLVLGEVRDYNGGMISKQNELLTKLRDSLSPNKKYNELLLENFFYSLSPVVMRTVLDPESLKKLFLMLLDSIAEGFYHDECYTMNVRAEPEAVYVMIGAQESFMEAEIKKALSQFQLLPAALASSCVYVYGTPYLGFIYRSDDPQEQRQFCIALQHAVVVCEQKKHAIASDSRTG